MRQLTDSERIARDVAKSSRDVPYLADDLEHYIFDMGFIAALDHSAAQLAAETKMTFCQCGHEESYHDSKDSHCEFPFCSCEYFSPDYPALEDRIAALEAERDKLRNSVDTLLEFVNGNITRQELKERLG